MPTRTNILLALVSCGAIVVAVVLYAQNRQLQNIIVECQATQTTMQHHATQLESNLRSAATQMQQLSSLAQEASERAAACETVDF